ncbi:hypothetical protein N7510_004003 [Penicillium lagena]|uniref:uncharacterized protein n=1 Tax=Penicillium lagena TaxID=94218 RepID=UPI0025422230|nr:uncharacterized protein N7510_004003 [Penicillium lagena]KAJ5620019.1 hypothetical protein N7510_004003 [Penicillium lagena]
MASSLKRNRPAAVHAPITPRTLNPRHAIESFSSSRGLKNTHNSLPTTAQLRTPFPTEMVSELDASGRPSEDGVDHVVAAIDMKDYGTVGCSYYSTEEETIYLLGDTRLGGMETIEALLLQVRPTIILTPPRVDLLDAQDQRQNLAQENESSSYLPYQVDVRPTSEFNHANAQSKLVSLDLSSTHEERFRFFVPHDGIAAPDEVNAEDMGFTLQEGRLLHISSSVDMENQVTIGCAGAILTYLQRRRATQPTLRDLGDKGSSGFRVHSLEMFSLHDSMWISGNTFLSLQIVQSESNPNMFSQGPGKKSSSGKEGLSIYGLFHRFAGTPQGRARLRRMFFCPSVNLTTIYERHDFIAVLSRPDNLAPLEKMTKALKHIKNLRPVLINLRKGVSTGSGKITGFKTTVWASLLAFAFFSIDIHDALRETSGAEMLPLRTKALRVFEAAQLYRVGRMIQEIVDIDSSEEQSRTVVKQGLDRNLDRMKDRYDGLSSLLKHVAIDVANTIPENLEIDINVIYFPQLGFNISIPLNKRGEATYNGSGEDWELMFITENRAYFKDFRMKELDEKLGDIYGLICEKEIEIVYDLAQGVLQYENVLVDASDICGEIDCLLALTHAASFYKLVRPRMVQHNIIKIKGGRHVLQELTVSSYVPNNTYLMGGSISNAEPAASLFTDQTQSMLLLTGPNYSGKSVYMKQVALIVYLAQIGSFVPADSAELGITDKILTKINTQDSVSNVRQIHHYDGLPKLIPSQIQSTFMNDLQQISLSLKQVTSQSLVIIDEFGKGTNECDGIGLACGILQHLLNLDDPPKVIAATHFHEIFENNFLSSHPRLQLGHMEVRVCEDSKEVEDQITYLYNCAAINGIDPAIISRATEIASLSSRGENLVAACAVLSPEETQALKEADALTRSFLGMNLSGYDDGLDGGTREALQGLFSELGQ